MERRRDRVLRDLIDEVQPVLAAQAFRLAERGVQGDCRWVEFARPTPTGAECAVRDDSPAAPAAPSVAFLHVADLQRIGARCRWPHPLGSPLPSRLAAQFWPCQPDDLTAPLRRDALVGAMRAWVATVLDAPAPAPLGSFA
jgi:class 3 adenylate cyclase